MGFGRVKVGTRRGALFVAAGLAALSLSACDTNPRDNQPRPPIPAGVSVQVTDQRVDLAPLRVGFGPATRQQILADERDGEIQGDPDHPMPVKLTIANTTQRPIRLELSGPARRVSPPVTPTGTEVYSTRLPTGMYRVRVKGRKRGAGELVVGPDRSSPQNDLLLP